MKNKIHLRTSVPGKKSKQLVKLDAKYLSTATKVAPLTITKGKGVWVEDLDGNTLLDFTNGMVGITGHCHPKVVQAMKSQLDKFLYFNGPDLYYEIQVKLAKKLTEIAPGNYAKKVFLSNSGAESIEAAWKITRWSTKRPLALAFLGAFHGRTMGALSLTASKAIHKGRFFPTTPGVTHIPYAYCYRCAYKLSYPSCDLWCARIIEEVYFKSILPPEEVGAIFFEPIQGEGGYVVPPPDYPAMLRKIADKYGILIVVDEVQAGIGRTGKMLAIENFNTVPDIVTLAKALGSGLSIGATVFPAKLDFKISGAHSNTYGGNPIPVAAALATIEVVQEKGVLENIKKLGDYFKNELMNLQGRYSIIGDVRGIGLMIGLEFVKDITTKEHAKKFRDNVLETAYKKGLILLPCGVSGLRFTPAITVTKREIDIALNVLEESIKKNLTGSL